MKRQSQWLFEVPFASEVASYTNSYSNLNRDSEWKIYEISSRSKTQRPAKSAKVTQKHATSQSPGSPPLLRFTKKQKQFPNQRAKDEQAYILEARLPFGVAGYGYECLVRTQFNFKLGIPQRGLLPDVGTNLEITLEGRKGGFSKHKEEQFKNYLNSKRGILVLFVPQLSKEAEKQLRKIGETEQAECNKQAKANNKPYKQLKIWVYETV